ncbi:Phosphatidylinositol 4-kinase PIK1alpha [Bienertia sinuspersici]
MSYHSKHVWKSGDERVTHLGLKALLPKDESITDSKDETSDSTNDLFESLFSDCEENRESVSNNSSLESPLFLSKWKLLERREEIEKERMYASFLSISRDKWSKCRPVHVRTEPLVDILGVSLIKHNSDEQEMWELFGSIYVSDGKKRCLIYEHEDEKKGGFKSISSPATLSLTGPDSFLSMESPTISIDLRDEVTGEKVVGSAELSTIVKSKKPQEFERIETITLCGSGYSAFIKYMALTFGVSAGVKVELFRQKWEEEQVEVYGTIYAEYSLWILSEKIRVNLFDKDSDDCERVTPESPIITLARSVVALPAYSSMKLYFNLVNRADNHPIVQDSCVFETYNYGGFWEIIPSKNEFNAKVTVDWREPFLLDDDQNTSFWSSTSHWSERETFSRWLPNSFTRAHTVLEVFSMFIGHQNNEQLQLYGMINVSDSRGMFNIFKRDKGDPYVLPCGSNWLPLEGLNHVFILDDYFLMSVDLDDIENKMSIKGSITSCYCMNQLEDPWLDRLFCSIVKGRNYGSFAAVHYSVFLYAFKARLKVHVLFKGEQSSSGCSRIYGSIICYYGDYGCQTDYARLYHNSVLFQRSEENPYEESFKNVEVEQLLKNPYEKPFQNVEGELSEEDTYEKKVEVELSRSVVAVPNDSVLQIEVDLTCCVPTRFRRHLKKMLDIQIGEEREVIQGDQVEIIVDVQWS